MKEERLNERTVAVRTYGDFACFTRPEAKVERVSYPVMTPSAARGILEAIYWHPQFTWRIEEIRVLNEVRTYSILRNEVNSKMSLQSDGLYADKDRSQRHAVCLRQVDYVICAEPVPMPGTEPAAKHRDIFSRRVERGQCYHRPALGTREFAAEFAPADDAPEPIDWTEDLGLMLWDLDFGRGRKPYLPQFFKARVDGGVLRVPLRPIGGQA
jgi:CRISPR-associated protein Cas5d